MDQQDAVQDEGFEGKRPYQAPRLKLYGSLTEMTNATMAGMSSDGVGKGMSGS